MTIAALAVFALLDVTAAVIGRDSAAATALSAFVVALLLRPAVTGIGARLHIGVRTIETYTNALFQKLRLHAAPDEHRRVRAVLAYLDATR